MRCETCKHWDRDNKYSPTYDNVTAHNCNKIVMLNHSNNYEKNMDDNVYDTSLPVEYEYKKNEDGWVSVIARKLHGLAYVEDGSSYYAALITHPYFGCCLWEENK